MRSLALLAAISAVALVVSAAPAAASPGDLDPSFDGDGRLATALRGTPEGAAIGPAVAVQPDGKIVVVGTVGTLDRGVGDDIAVIRYDVDGSLDATFGADGLVRTDFNGGADEGGAVTLQPDGRIVIAGSATRTAGERDFAVVRYMPDGSLDESFDLDGRTSANLAFNDSASSIALAPDGRIVVAGAVRFAGVGVARFDAAGTLDSTFSGDGTAFPGGGGDADFGGRGLSVQPDGKILFGGSSCFLTKCFDSPWVSRFNLDGAPDPSFVLRGLGFSAPRITLPDDFELLADGKILLTGGKPNLTRLSPNGGVDQTFACRGGAVGDGQLNPETLVVEREGGIVLAGTTRSAGDDYDFAVLRHAATGAPDLAFGDGNAVATDFGGGDFAEDVAVAPDGRIVVVGTSRTSETASRVVIARYQSGALRPGRLDCRPPKIRVFGIPRASCTRRDFTAEVRIEDASSLRRVSVNIDGEVVRETIRKRFEQRVDVHALRRGLHHLNLFASDQGGFGESTSVPFRRCVPRGAANPQRRRGSPPRSSTRASR